METKALIVGTNVRGVLKWGGSVMSITKKMNRQKIIFFACVLGSLTITVFAFQNFTFKKESLGELRTDDAESMSILRSALANSDQDHERNQMALNGADQKEKRKGRSVDSLEVESTIKVDEYVEEQEGSYSEY